MSFAAVKAWRGGVPKIGVGSWCVLLVDNFRFIQDLRSKSYLC
jgi:hypothetical protein